MSELIRAKEVVRYNGHSLSANGSVNFSLKANYSELKNTIMIMQMLNEDIKLMAKVSGNKPFKLGSFRLKQIVIDGDGESIIKFNGLNDYIEMDNLNMLPMNDDDNKEFILMLEADIEVDLEADDDNDE